jgi:hypothetical protein
VRITAQDKIIPRGGTTPKSTKEQSQAQDDEDIWQTLVPQLVHPTKIELVEALSWIGEPLSVSEFYAVLSPSKVPIDYVRYHLKGLHDAEVVMEAPKATLTGPDEQRYIFPGSHSTEKTRQEGRA